VYVVEVYVDHEGDGTGGRGQGRRRRRGMPAGGHDDRRCDQRGVAPAGTATVSTASATAVRATPYRIYDQLIIQTYWRQVPIPTTRGEPGCQLTMAS
jgi:hypothetical protein